jgi:hypothetical protein
MDGPLLDVKKKGYGRSVHCIRRGHLTSKEDERERLIHLTRPPVGPTRQPRGVRSVGGAPYRGAPAPGLEPEDPEAGENK